MRAIEETNSLSKIQNFHYFLKELANVDWATYWNPLLYIENMIRQEKETKVVSAKSDLRTLKCIVTERRKIRGILMESLELQRFPFDVQVNFYIG